MSRFGSLFALALVAAGGGACSHNPKSATAATVSSFREPTPSLARRRTVADAGPPISHIALSSTGRGGTPIYFDFDSAQLRQSSAPVLQSLASSLRAEESSKVRIEGNCDQLGTVEYNLALGEQRTRTAKDYLVRSGLAKERITTISYGSQRPKYPGLDEADRQKNRRDDFLVTR